MKKSFLFVLFFCFSISYAQQISVLTCGRGKEIYSTFGHSAIRIKDDIKGTDDVYNYGLFDFQDPKFIPNFINGYLNYMVGKESYADFIFQYQYQNRSVSEQVLHLDSIQTKKIIDFLEWNVKEENKFYRYDFLRNNCATKIIDVLQKGHVAINETPYTQSKTYRDLIHDNAAHNVPWIDWGMDVCLGYRCDENTSRIQRCFLPDYVAQTLEISTLPKEQKALVISQKTLLNSMVVDNNNYSIFNPLSVYLAIFALSILLYVKQIKKRKWFYGFFYLIIGIFGLIVAYEWFFTEHFVTKFNYNLLWLNPMSLILAWGIFRKNIPLMRFMVVLITFLALFCLILNVTTNADLHWASLWIIFSMIINGISIQKHPELK